MKEEKQIDFFTNGFSHDCKLNQTKIYKLFKHIPVEIEAIFLNCFLPEEGWIIVAKVKGKGKVFEAPFFNGIYSEIIKVDFTSERMVFYLAPMDSYVDR